ncbi:acyl-CoA reductase [Phaeocystidibacter marisrubri]|uniref:Acyl-CoA reductase n=1 Tax=Phaeocystidibacter marisrubri TaxID=1577780 RepID=A0A6L3ZHB4_9FLAO|nr:acyl-CoA reductase [Phaeocystidibacter marisrubri]KAB2817019.1 acyl-CoA reductase [Phaeocystidibacter marisrubri]GGH77183.1 acyl-CoA reductase [Phaeocystidibacter marisrubri]
MLKFEDRFAAWNNLGTHLTRFLSNLDEPQTGWNEELMRVVNTDVHHNGWFDKSEVLHALGEWAKALSEESLSTWVEKYPRSSFEPTTSKVVGIVMAGNIPLVGLHDLLTITLTGHVAKVKMSSDDARLLPILLKQLGPLNEQIEIVERLKDIDAVIATGSDNTARYFEHYFGKYPNIIRKNRKSVAVLKGDEDPSTIEELGKDIFRYFGLGCRNVSKLYLPADFDLNRIFEAWLPYQEVVQNNKYANNYDYHRALFLLDRETFLENGFVVLKEGERMSTPVSVIHYERYSDIDTVVRQLEEKADSIQCVVGNVSSEKLAVVPFGESQSPKLWDYADGVDTVTFLSTI